MFTLRPAICAEADNETRRNAMGRYFEGVIGIGGALSRQVTGIMWLFPQARKRGNSIMMTVEGFRLTNGVLVPARGAIV
jgi:hypothetical protein